jgi:ADP-dependent NAD(P)H-hydrate dehydratase / NAD(P)H-hydrate epimerase
MSSGLELLTTAEMAEADRLAVAAGVPFLTLMENAGRAVADEAEKMVKPGARIAVLCGPGNNGGDGFVAARLLKERGYDVQVHGMRAIDTLKGDAAVMARQWSGETRHLGQFDGSGCGLAIDALFGTGLSRPLAQGDIDVVWPALVIAAAKRFLAVDVPSGVNATTGAIAQWSQPCERTVTFYRHKLGHVLFPARALCGDIVVADIGTPADAIIEIWPRVHLNRQPSRHLLVPSHRRGAIHKYTRGHAVAVCGPPHATGAARLGARGALRIGAGLVTVASPLTSVAANAVHLTAIMIAPFAAPEGLTGVLSDKRKNAVLIGPACGVGAETRRMVEIALASDAAVVLDADALTSFAPDEPEVQSLKGVGFLGATKSHLTADPSTLFALIRENSKRPVVLTPHEGEFKRLFPDIGGVGRAEPAKPNTAGSGENVGLRPEGASAQPTVQKTLSKLDRARAAAERSGAVIILKGPDTVIAAPDGRAAINDNAPPWLASAGSGDVLAGFVTGLLAQGMPAFEAACAAVWLHGECANQFGPGLIAEDVPEQLPEVLRDLGIYDNWPGKKVE